MQQHLNQQCHHYPHLKLLRIADHHRIDRIKCLIHHLHHLARTHRIFRMLAVVGIGAAVLTGAGFFSIIRIVLCSGWLFIAVLRVQVIEPEGI